MSRSRVGRRPADPDEILRRAAEERAQRRRDEKDPATWRVSAELIQLPTSADVAIVRGAREKILAARRSDPFDLLHGAKGGLSDEQHRAAQYFVGIRRAPAHSTTAHARTSLKHPGQLHDDTQARPCDQMTRRSR